MRASTLTLASTVRDQRGNDAGWRLSVLTVLCFVRSALSEIEVLQSIYLDELLVDGRDDG